MLSAMFTWYIDSHGLMRKNPCSGIKLYRRSKKFRNLEIPEIRSLVKELKAQSFDPGVQALALALLTGARGENVWKMKWEDLDSETCTWTIPAEGHKAGNKTGDYVQLPLSDVACDILKARWKLRLDGSPYVFPSARSKKGHMGVPRKPWLRICESAGIDTTPKDTVIHSLRHTYSAAAEQFTTEVTRAKLMGHSTGSAKLTTGRFYNDAFDERLRNIQQQITDFLWKWKKEDNEQCSKTTKKMKTDVKASQTGQSTCLTTQQLLTSQSTGAGECPEPRCADGNHRTTKGCENCL